MTVRNTIAFAAALGAVGVAPAWADGTMPACGVNQNRNGALQMVTCAQPRARTSGRLTLRLDTAARARPAPDPLGMDELGRRQLNLLIAGL